MHTFNRQTDRRTPFSSLVSAGMLCSAEKTLTGAAFASGVSDQKFSCPEEGAEKLKVNCMVVTVKIKWYYCYNNVVATNVAD